MISVALPNTQPASTDQTGPSIDNQPIDNAYEQQEREHNQGRTLHKKRSNQANQYCYWRNSPLAFLKGLSARI